MRQSYFFVFGLASAVAVLSCGKKKSSTSGDEVADGVSNALAVGYPDGLSVPSFPQTTGTTALMLDPTADKGQTLEQKREAQKQVLEGNVDDCFQNLRANMDRRMGPQELCYQFDQEMIYGKTVGGPGTAETFGTTNGKSRKEGSLEACMVSFAREEMKDIELQIDVMLDRAQAMACLAKKNGLKLPQNTNDEINVTDIMNNNRPKDRTDAPMFDSVILRRLADVEGRPVFQTEVKSTRSSVIKEELTILHSPASASDNNTYNGIITVKRSGDSRDVNKVNALSIEYARALDGSNKKIRASVRRARLATSVATMFDTTGRVNLPGISEGAKNDTAEAISLVEFDVNQADNTGNLVYWKNPGGDDGESARGFVFKIEKVDGVLKGCSISGAARRLSIRNAMRTGKELKPDGFYHPFFHGPNCSFLNGADVCQTPTSSSAPFNHMRPASAQEPEAFWANTKLTGPDAEAFVRDQTGPLVSRQCFKQDTATGEYVLDVTTNEAGFELIKVDSPNFIAPPVLAGVKDRPLKR